ncbi:MAG: choice-of-anchor Q domain-containing protein, partial [Chthoniobacterales bacterium]
VYNGGIFTATNCTFISNTALNGGGIISRFVNGLSNTTLRNCTIFACQATSTGTTAGDGGGGLYAEGGAQQYHLANNIIANNSSNSSPVTNPDIRGQVTSDGHNFIGIIGNAMGLVDGVNGDQVGTRAFPKNAMFDLYGNNGGPTDTISLTSSSTAINAGDNNLAPVTDQRGYFRSGVSDIGAFEFGGTVPPPVSLGSLASRKTHPGVGDFDLNLPLTGPVGVESRSGGANGVFTLVLTFSNPLANVGTVSVTSGAGRVSMSAIGSDPHQYFVTLSGVSNAQKLGLTANNVTDSLGSHSDTVSVVMGLLVGDANGDAVVNSADATIARNRSGQLVDATNFRTDFNVDGVINSADATIARNNSGQSVPSAPSRAESRARY